MTPERFAEIKALLDIVEPMPDHGPFQRRLIQYTPDDIARALRDLINEIERLQKGDTDGQDH